MVKALAIVIAVAILIENSNSTQADEAPLWNALRSGGHVVLLRHALAPGTGDPAAFALSSCATQRNLSAQGRAQAEAIGKRFRDKGITVAEIYSSQWCRCRDTAQSLKLGPVSELPALNSFYSRPEYREPQTQALKAWLRQQELSEVHILVTHQVNITELTGVYPSSGELVIVSVESDGELSVIGSIETD
jgi:phosphohistidine phosphatase SixA